MATIGLDKLYYAEIIKSRNGYEEYGIPVQLAKAISASLTVELAEGTLYADDALSEKVSEFKSGKISLGVDDIGTKAAQTLTGASLDQNGVLVSSTEDTPMPVAIGFRAKKSNGKYRYFWLYKVIFSVPSTELATKGESISFSTPKIEGTIMRRNKPDIKGNHPWKAEVDEVPTKSGESVIRTSEKITRADIQSVIDHWYDEVYEPSYQVNISSSSQTVSVGETVTLTVDRVSDANQYEWYDVTDESEELRASTGSNTYTTAPFTSEGTHKFYCKILRVDDSTVVTDTIAVNVASGIL